MVSILSMSLAANDNYYLPARREFEDDLTVLPAFDLTSHCFLSLYETLCYYCYSIDSLRTLFDCNLESLDSLEIILLLSSIFLELMTGLLYC